MKVKGSAVATLPLFIKENFGEDGFQRWFASLSSEAQEVYNKNICTG